MPSRFGNGRAVAATPSDVAEKATPAPATPADLAALAGDATTESDCDSDATGSDADDAPPFARRTAAYSQVERTRSRSLSPVPTRPPSARVGVLEPSTPGASVISTDDQLTAAQPFHSIYSSPTSTEDDEKDKNVAVVCRVRPTSALEESSGRSRPVIDFDQDGRTVHLHNLEPPPTPGHQDRVRRGRQKLHSFHFRAVFRPMDSQAVVYERVGRPLVDSVMEGFNAAVIAYGQTGSGKTYTMIGDEHDPTDPAGFGMIPRLTNDIFERIESRKEAQVVDVVRCSYIEVYMERVRDLLSAPGTQSSQDLPLRESRRHGGLWVAGATEVPVSSWEDVAAILARGNLARVTAATQSNENSSRSHAIFIFAVATNDMRAMLTTTSQLYAVDLAGSENVRKSEVEGLQMDEAKKINTSLLALGQVVYALTQGSQSGRHVPYRDSKLTRILQNTFGGNSRTAMVIATSPAEENYRETLSSLRFGDRTQSVRNAPTANVYRSAEELEKLLALAEEERTAVQEHAKAEAQRLTAEITQLTEERNHWRSKVDDLKAALVAAQAALANKDRPDDQSSDTESDDGSSTGRASGAGRKVRVRRKNGDVVTRVVSSSLAEHQQVANTTADGVVQGGSLMATARLEALRTLSSLAPAPATGEELFTLLRANTWAVVAVDSQSQATEHQPCTSGDAEPGITSPRSGNGIAAAMYGCIVRFDAEGMSMAGNDLWRSLVMRRRGPSTPGRGASHGDLDCGSTLVTGLHTERAAVHYCAASSSGESERGAKKDCLLVEWEMVTSSSTHVPAADEDVNANDANLHLNSDVEQVPDQNNLLQWDVKMVRQDGDEAIELTGELLLPPLPIQKAASSSVVHDRSATVLSTVVLHRLPDSVVGVLELELAGAHQRMRDAQVATIQAQKGLRRMTTANQKLTESLAAAEAAAVQHGKAGTVVAERKSQAAVKTPRHRPETPKRQPETPRQQPRQQEQGQEGQLPSHSGSRPKRSASRGGGCCSRPK